MLFTRGGGLWAVRVSRVYVNAVVPFWRVLAISSPLTHPTQGIMGIKEWDCVTLASHSHSSIGASHWGRMLSAAPCVICVCVWKCVFMLGMHVLFSQLWRKKKEGRKDSHINTFSKGSPCSADHQISETRVSSLTTRQAGEQVRSENYMKAHRETDILHRMSWNFKRVAGEWGIAPQTTQQEVVFYLLICLYQPIN